VERWPFGFHVIEIDESRHPFRIDLQILVSMVMVLLYMGITAGSGNGLQLNSEVWRGTNNRKFIQDSVQISSMDCITSS
jgi:hypothetical protein